MYIQWNLFRSMQVYTCTIEIRVFQYLDKIMNKGAILLLYVLHGYPNPHNQMAHCTAIGERERERERERELERES
jgi:hypothetical protein